MQPPTEEGTKPAAGPAEEETKSLADQAAEIGAQYFENEVIPEEDALTQEVVDAAAKAKRDKIGGKKRKSSKKRKSMKKKGGMKRKSMKVKA